MEITFLGTGSSHGVPINTCNCKVCRSVDFRDKRLRSALLIRDTTTTCVVDCGPDFRFQMLREKVKKIDALFFTHEHSDHVAGVDDLRPFTFDSIIPVYAKSRVLKSIKLRYPYIFDDSYKAKPKLNLQEIVDNSPININTIEITPIEILHGKLDILGYKIGNKIAYLTDVKTIPNTEKLNDLDVLIINALRKEPHDGHLNLEEALAYIEELKPKKAYLTHIDHKLGRHQDIKLPKSVELAYDTLSFEV